MSAGYQEVRALGACERAVKKPRDCAISKGPLRLVQSAMEVEQALVRAISRRAGAGIQSLQVQMIGSRVVLRGWAVSYHVVQLAIAGLFEACAQMHLDQPEQVELDIDVSDGNSLSAPKPR
jgi:hypothetical protein